MYMLVNIAYFAAVPKQEILDSGQILAATFFKNMFGARAQKAMAGLVAVSAFGNVMSVIFSQGRSTFTFSPFIPLSLRVGGWPFLPTV